MMAMNEKSFEDLKREVWDRGLCSGCGACIAVCPGDVLCFNRDESSGSPRNIGYCKQATDTVNCGACYAVCPRVHPVTAPPLGNYISILSAQAAFTIPRKQSGGAVTAILANALDEGFIDAVVTVTEDRWTLQPASVVITSSGDLIQQAGSRYSWWVPLLGALKTAVVDRKFRRIAVVGVPCVAQAVQRIRESDNDLLKPYARSIRLMIGLFCTETFDYHALVEERLGKVYHISPRQIQRLDVRGKLEVTLTDGSTRTIPLKELDDTIREGCHSCTDFTAINADISAGSIGSAPGHTTIVIRNPEGMSFIEHAVSHGRLITSEEVDIASIEKLAQAKIKRGKQQ
jgi:coenzyme F420 hydrogenase subunit beta